MNAATESKSMWGSVFTILPFDSNTSSISCIADGEYISSVGATDMTVTDDGKLTTVGGDDVNISNDELPSVMTMTYTNKS